jgi:hypothetical protein
MRDTSAGKRNWIGKATAKMEAKGTKGVFSGDAKKAGMSTSAYATKVLGSSKSSPLQKKRAQFAKNASGGN